MVSLGRVVVLYDDLPVNASLDQQDVLLQVDAVSSALNHMGFNVFKLTFSVNDDTFRDILLHINPIFVFNLVESVSSDSKLSYQAPALLEKLGIPYTGCPAKSIFLTTDKIAAKIMMKQFEISTPAWVSASHSDGFVPGETYIIKALYEDASIGLCDGSVMPFYSMDDIRTLLCGLEEEFQREYFAEKYIEGREFGIPVIGEGGKPRMIAPYEIHFAGYDERNKAKILDYNSKWDKASFEYRNTFPVSIFRHEDEALLCEMQVISEKLWEHFDLKGYARIDFRVDREGKPWVLEINANPCINPDDSGGFLETAKKSGFNFIDIVRKIIMDTRVHDCPMC